nr:hypothetical protein [Desulfobacterales bacterium]
IDNMLNIRGLNYGIRNKIVQRSGGNPFFIEEVIRSFIDEGGVVLKNGSFEITDKIEKMIIPHTINDMLMARIDCLEDETRNLVKIASVIGRNFFYRILTEVAKTVEDLDNKLSYLKEIQLIRERKRLEELEYLFKHALVQEAAYKSILRQKRKEIHLYVARSIEKVFNDRLHDFYGMLALHYSRGEDEENSEKYLIKAGEKALRSSASSEALHYYQEALNLYLKKYGDNTDNEKVAMLERNIALAYYNRGQNTEAVRHFNNVLAFWGEKEINLTISGKFKLLIRFSYFIVGLYLPLLRWRKRPTNKDCDIHDLVSDKLQCIGSLDTKRLLFELVNYSKRLITLDISYLKQGVAAFSGWSYVFSYGGLSFRLSRKILEISKEIIDSKDAISVLYYEMFIHWYCFVSGDLKLMEEYNDDLVEENLININPIIFGYIAIHRMIKTELGYYDEAWAKIQKLYEIGNVYEHDLAFVIKFYNNCALLTKYRKLPEALIELEEGIAFIQKTPFSIYLQACYSLKAQVQIMLGDVQEAENTIHYAYELKAKVKPPPQKIMHFLQSKFLYALYSLEESLKIGNISDITKHKDTALNAGKRAVSNSRKVAFDRVETYRYMGIFYWLICKRKKALKWWRKSISEGERLTARVELSRTYFEVGKRLLEPQNKNKALNGITAEEYLKKARTMFVEMDLQWDLDESDKIAASG